MPVRKSPECRVLDVDMPWGGQGRSARKDGRGGLDRGPGPGDCLCWALGQLHKETGAGIPGCGKAVQGTKLGGEIRSARQGQEIHLKW